MHVHSAAVSLDSTSMAPYLDGPLLPDRGRAAIPEAAILPIPVTTPLERGTIERPGLQRTLLSLFESGTMAQPIRTGDNMIGKSVGSIVSDKQIQELIAVPASAMVSEAVSRMSDKGVGAILIQNSPNTVDGIFTERDLMTRVVNAGRDAKTTAIGTVMSSQVRRVEEWTSIEDALSLMVVHGYRHLLVEEASKIKGIVSIRDLMASMVIPDTPMAHEGRTQVTRGRAEAALRVVASAEPRDGAEH